jgi:DNA-binding CsgD family transcriptional regulator
LESWSRRRTTAQALAQRSKIVSLLAEGLRAGEIAARLEVHRNTVAKWRSDATAAERPTTRLPVV